jgi:hypothetical protein
MHAPDEHMLFLWYPAKSVKPEKPDFEPHTQSFLNNLYLLVII